MTAHHPNRNYIGHEQLRPKHFELNGTEQTKD